MEKESDTVLVTCPICNNLVDKEKNKYCPYCGFELLEFEQYRVETNEQFVR